MKMKYLDHYLLKISVVLIIICFSACRKFVEISPPQTFEDAASLFSSDATATSAITGLYGRMMASTPFVFNGALSIYCGLSADELIRTSPLPAEDAFATNSLRSDNNLIDIFWAGPYSHIYQANSILEGMEKPNNVSDPVKFQIIGEAKFVRALSYLYLVNIFGDVPLQTSTNYEINGIMPRTKTLTVYNQIVEDLLDAQNLLQSAYPTINKTRPNKWSAAALLARVYLYENDWPDAEKEASMVIDSGHYSLLNNLNDVFLVNSGEAIWQLAIVNKYINTAEGNYFIPYSQNVLPLYTLTSFLVNAFEPTDFRRRDWIDSTVVNGATYYYPYKYKVRVGGEPYTEYNMVLRLAEQFLIRSEARAQQSNILGALSDLNIIRNRAGLLAYNSTDKNSILLAIENERQKELFTEFGHRWFDLKRTGRADTVLGLEKGLNWRATDTLFPISLGDLRTNPFLIQNPGY